MFFHGPPGFCRSQRPQDLEGLLRDPRDFSRVVTLLGSRKLPNLMLNLGFWKDLVAGNPLEDASKARQVTIPTWICWRCCVDVCENRHRTDKLIG